MRRILVSLLSTYVAFPLYAQSTRTLEFGVIAGASHHDFHFRYPGEHPWESDYGYRVDFRMLPTSLGTLGVSALVNRYSYSVAGTYCVDKCSVIATPASDGAATMSYVEPWQVTRFGVGVTLDRAIVSRVHGQLGLLGGSTHRKSENSLGHQAPSSFTPWEWFAGAEGGASYRWRDLAVGATAEYGVVPHTDYALRPYYGRVSARVAYAVPLTR
ncbi:MAG: hypothetical protein U0163_19680 [Gemmatimonadaceae bacterium]